MEEEGRGNADTITTTATTTAAQPLSGTDEHTTTTTTTTAITTTTLTNECSNNNTENFLTKPTATEQYFDSDTTIQSEQDNAANKMAGNETKETLEQLLKAHSEQSNPAANNTTSNATVGRVEVTLNRPDILTEPAAVLQEAKASAAAGSSVTLSRVNAASSSPETVEGDGENEATSSPSIRSIGSLVCRICHNSENPERLVSPCFCKGSLTYVHIHCLERWISTSRSTTCELCQFQYNTEQTLRYTCFQSLRMWYSRSMSRRALQEDCQMFSLLTLVAFGIIGTLLVGIQYYFLQGHSWGLSRIWTKGWLIFFLLTTLAVYFINIYMIVRSQLAPWYRWWQSARDIKLILENRKPFQLHPAKRAAQPPHAEQLATTTMFSPTAQQPARPQPRPEHLPAQPAPPPPSPPPQPTVAALTSAPVQLSATLIELPKLPELPELLAEELPDLHGMEVACKMPLTAETAAATAAVALTVAAVEIPLEAVAC